MEAFENFASEYLNKLDTRANISKIHHSHQDIGLQLADILEDRPHKGLYMRLAKKYDNKKLLEVAKSIAENNTIIKKGAYFMKIWYNKDSSKKISENSSSIATRSYESPTIKARRKNIQRETNT